MIIIAAAAAVTSALTSLAFNDTDILARILADASDTRDRFPEVAS